MFKVAESSKGGWDCKMAIGGRGQGSLSMTELLAWWRCDYPGNTSSNTRKHLMFNSKASTVSFNGYIACKKSPWNALFKFSLEKTDWKQIKFCNRATSESRGWRTADERGAASKSQKNPNGTVRPLSGAAHPFVHGPRPFDRRRCRSNRTFEASEGQTTPR